MRATSVLIILYFLSLTSSVYAAKTEKVSLQLSWQHQFQFAGYYMAKEKGFYNEAGLEVQIKEMRHLHDITEDLENGISDYGIGNSDLLIKRSKGKDVILLAAIFQSSPVIILTKRSSGIHSIDALAGKRLEGGADIIHNASIFGMLGKYHPKEIPTTDTHGIVQDLIDDKVDAIVIYRSNELYTMMLTGIGYELFNPKDYGYDEHSDILFISGKEAREHRARALAMRKASLRGWEYAFEHIDETVDLILKKYNTQGKSKEALLYEAYTLRELAYFKTKHVGTINKETLASTYASYDKAGLLQSKFDLENILIKKEHGDIKLTEDERAYLSMKTELIACGVSDFLPYFGHSDNTVFGIVPDFFKSFANSIDVPIRFELRANMQACVQDVKDGNADILALMSNTPNLYTSIIPTHPYTDDSMVLVTKVEAPYINDVKAYTGKVGIIGTHKNIANTLRKRLPRQTFFEVSSTKEGLRKVADGRLDTLIDLYQSTTFIINNEYVGELKINTAIQDLTILGAAGVYRENVLLKSILDKAIDAFSMEEKTKIINRWIRTKRITRPDYLMLGELSLFALLVILGLLYRQRFLQHHNRLLIRANKSIKEQQEKIKEQKQIYELVFDNTTDGLLIMEDGVFIDCNDAIINILHIKDKQDILTFGPEHFSPTFQPDGTRSDEKAATMLAMASKKKSHRFEWMHTRSTGEEFWSEITLTPFMVKKKELIYVVWRDISEKVELELQNSYLKERIELAFDGSQDGLWDWNLVDNSVYLSPRWKAMLGYEDHELPNELETWRSLVHPDDLQKALEDVAMTIDGKSDRLENKHRLRHKNGRWVWVYDRGKVQFDINHKAIRMIGTHTDLSTEINLNNRLTALNKDLEARIQYEVSQNLKKEELLRHQARLAQMGEMLSMIAHQWRQPLTAISAAVGTLQLNTMLEQYDQATFSAKLGNISDYAQHLSQTINDFRDFFKTHKMMEETTLEEIIEHTLLIVRPSLEDRRITLHFDLAANVRFNTYVNEFRQVVLNLIKNAEDALLENAISAPRITIRTYVSRDYCMLEIGDNAGGVPDDLLAKVFDLYFTTKEQDGTGLGLYMSKVIIEEHCNGTIRVHNDDSGALFTIKVPL